MYIQLRAQYDTSENIFDSAQYSSNNHSINKPINLLYMTLNLRFVLFKEEKKKLKLRELGRIIHIRNTQPDVGLYLRVQQNGVIE